MKKTAREIIAENVDALMRKTEALSTQEKLGARTGIAPSTIGRIRRGQVDATAGNLQSIADAFKVPVGYLFGDRSANGEVDKRSALAEDIAKMVTAFCRVDETGREGIMAAVDQALEDNDLSFSPWDNLQSAQH